MKKLEGWWLHIKNFIYKQKMLFILLAAFLTAAVLTALLNLPGLMGGTSEEITVPEQNGIYDLTGAASLEKAVFRLPPGTSYYPDTYLAPENVNTSVPESIDRYKEIRSDYLSQRFVVIVPDSSSVYTLTFTLSSRHALRVFVNGVLTGQTGKPGTAKISTEVWENNITCNASAKNGKMEIILHSAQFYHAKSGASLAELRLSKSGTVPEPYFFARIKGTVIIGALLCAAVLLLGTYLMLFRTRTTLYFATACIVMSLREFLQSQIWTYFPISGNLSFMLEYLSVVLLTVFLSLYLGQYATGTFLRCIQYTAIFGSCAYGVCIIFGDSVFYTSVLKYYQIFLALCIVPGITGLLLKMRKPAREQGAAIFGIAVFYLAALYDIVMYSDIFGDRSNIPVAETAMLVFVLAQTVSLFLMSNRVLAETKAAEHTLEAEKSALESLNRLKTEFLSNVSHELKTPLTVISGYAQLIFSLLSGSENTAVRNKARIISSEADRLALMVGQVLDVTRIEEGGLLLKKCPCHIDELIYQAVETHFPILNKGDNRLEINVKLDLPDVNVDSDSITQVLVNLIANALRHTAHGVITVSACQAGEFMEISVSDTGTGMSPEALSGVFTRFRAGASETGTGLGLYICKYLVEEHGGIIKVNSMPGKGTTVSFSLPL
ncbi:signal transduction histidine kinase [Ruminiclostridium sufflavum DSM 19573]|uniref:histidine kinase n=1 Tax=Ruminiclostridium sufflavum DSM 19573 TaxID=1121337 RepID=A0A318XX58_9FIRM|nr:sensor histidine kinase [Ruminiclostridium sufflavum]PYG87366.1 signal transduction histidine kinase [Ruminiclostridium sufflavum DSM 19573]